MAVNLTTSPVVSSGTISSAGLGTNLDVSSIVPQLVQAEIGPSQQRLQGVIAQDTAEISALGIVKSNLSALQNALKAILTGGALKQLSASSADSTVFNATASTSAVAGTYKVQVQQLAQANSIASTAYTSADDVVGNGPITITAGGSSFTVTLSDGNNTLADLRDAINGASDNSGVSATIVNGTDGAHLLLNATETGLTNAVSVDSGGLLTFNSVQGAADAIVSVAGFEYHSSSNTVAGAIDGVTLNLNSAKPNTDIALTVSRNTASAVSAVQSIVDNYNAALQFLNTNTAYNSDTQQGGALLGDPAINSLVQRLRSTVSSAISTPAGGISALSQIGISSDVDGKLTLDSSQLISALQSNPSAVQNLFSSDGGVGTQLNNFLNGYTQSNGVLDAETGGLQNQIDDANSQLSALAQRGNTLTTQYTNQFNAINTVVAQYTNIGSFLTQQFTALTQSTSKSG